MSKLTLQDITSGYAAPAKYNANNTAIETAVENTLSRDGTEPNEMNAPLDMNSNLVINLGAPVNLNDAARLQDILDASDLTSGTAALTTIVDSGAYYSSPNVEGALQEIGVEFDGVQTELLDIEADRVAGEFVYFPRTGAEISAGKTPVRFNYPEGDCRRWGVSTTNTAAQNAVAFNDALSIGGLVFLEGAQARGTYVVDDNLDILSNTVFRIGAGITIQGAPGKAWLDTGILDINGRDNVTVELYGSIDGNKANNATGRAFGIRVNSSTDVLLCGNGSIVNCPGSDATGTLGGDGIYVGGAGTERFTARDLLLDSNVRQGISITRCLDFKLIGLRCHNQTGSNPGAGIDLEPDTPGVLKRGQIIGCTTENNYRGMDLVDCEEVTVVGHISRNNRWNSIQVIRCTDLRLEAKIVVGNPTDAQTGTIHIQDSEHCVLDLEVIGSFDAQEANNCIRFAEGCRHIRLRAKVRNCKGSAIGLGTTGMGEDNTDILIEGSHFYNCTDPAQNAPVIFIDGNSGGSFYPKRLTIRSCHIYDDRTGGNEATAGTLITANIPASVYKDYRFGRNKIEGPTVKHSGNYPLMGSVTWNPANLADGAGETSPNITVTGAAVGDAVKVYAPYNTQGMLVTGYVSAADTVNIRIQNETTGAIDLASGTWFAEVVKQFED